MVKQLLVAAVFGLSAAGSAQAAEPIVDRAAPYTNTVLAGGVATWRADAPPSGFLMNLETHEANLKAFLEVPSPERKPFDLHNFDGMLIVGTGAGHYFGPGGSGQQIDPNFLGFIPPERPVFNSGGPVGPQPHVLTPEELKLLQEYYQKHGTTNGFELPGVGALEPLSAVSLTPVPEPACISALSIGALLMIRRRR